MASLLLRERAVAFEIPVTRDRTDKPAAAFIFEWGAAAPYPSDAPGGYSGDQGVIGHIPGHDGAGGDQRPSPDGQRGYAHGAGADRGTRAHEHADGIPILSGFTCAVDIDGARKRVVREYHCGADEYSVFQVCRFVDESVVLYLAAVADGDAGTDVRTPPQNAVSAENRVLAHLGEMPDYCSRSDVSLIIDVCRGGDAGLRE